MTNRIPAAKALIGWNINEKRRVSEVVVLLDGRGGEWKRTGTPAEWQRSRFTHGACFADWLDGSWEMTPESVFAEITAHQGCANNLVYEQALAEFSKIEECTWARAMVAPIPTTKLLWSVA